MRAVDTSVVVAAFASWHEGHAAAKAAMAPGVRLPAHCAIESYSVLTRLPPPHRVDGEVAWRFIRERFTDPLLVLDPAAHASLLDRLVVRSVTGGAAYDGLVGLTAAANGARLLSRDRRAARVYEMLDVDFELMG